MNFAAKTIMVLTFSDLIIGFLIFITIPLEIHCIVGGFSAAPPPPDDPVIFARLYGRNARIEGYRNPTNGLYSFTGIRYAYSPEGIERFLRPRFRHLKGDINATTFGPPCPQPDQQNPNQIIGHEDCLLVNVFTPEMPDENTLLPVVVFIHGGGFRFGSANQYGPGPLNHKRLIFVSIQYRLGTLGIIGDGTTEFSGNVALFDMAAAIRWTHEYIKFFGGDPEQITIAGHGSGATSAIHLSTSDEITDDMIAGVIAMSGSAYTKYAIDELPTNSIKQIAQINNCSNKNELEIIRCLRNISVNDLIRHDSLVQFDRLNGRRQLNGMTGMAGFNPCMGRSFDDRSLPTILNEEPSEKIKEFSMNKNKKKRKIPLFTGVTKDETAQAFLLPEIQTIFNTTSEFLLTLSNSLKLDKLFNNSLMNNDLFFSNNQLFGENFLNLDDFLKIPESFKPERIISKIIESTSDALFNLPALLTTQAWSQYAPSFLYSFEYIGSGKSLGRNFLNGLPIISRNTKKLKDRVSHGDELGYLFEPRDLYGNAITEAQITNPTDQKVSDTFSQLIAQFIYENVVPKNETTSADTFTLFKPFTPQGSSFIKIDKEATFENDFRICQLSLWGATIESVKTKTCAFLTDYLDDITLKVNNLADSMNVDILPNIFENEQPPSPSQESQTHPLFLPPPPLPKGPPQWLPMEPPLPPVPFAELWSSQSLPKRQTKFKLF